jgi:hypothetical protein
MSPGHWRHLETVCEGILEEAVAFIDLSYERIIAKLDVQLTNPAYQRLWGWTPVSARALTPVNLGTPAALMASFTIQACSASRAVSGTHPTVISSGARLP